MEEMRDVWPEKGDKRRWVLFVTGGDLVGDEKWSLDVVVSDLLAATRREEGSLGFWVRVLYCRSFAGFQSGGIRKIND